MGIEWSSLSSLISEAGWFAGPLDGGVGGLASGDFWGEGEEVLVDAALADEISVDGGSSLDEDSGCS